MKGTFIYKTGVVTFSLMCIFAPAILAFHNAYDTSIADMGASLDHALLVAISVAIPLLMLIAWKK